MRQVWGDVAFVGGQTFRAARGPAVVVTVLAVVLAFVPAVQVLATAALIRGLGPGATMASLVLPLLAVVAVVGLTGPAHTIWAVVGERAMLRTCAAMQSRLAVDAARMPPSRLADARIAAEVEGHSRAIIDAVSHFYVDAVVGVESMLAAAGVVAALYSFSPLAAGLVVLAMLPALVAGRYVSRAHERMWSIIGRVYQRDRYLRETLSQQRSLTELASLGTTDRVAQMVRRQQDAVVEARDIPLRASLASGWVVGLASTALLAFAIGAVIVGLDFGPAAAAGVFGVVAAVGAVAQGSHYLSLLIQYAPQTTKLRDFHAAAPPPRRHAIAESADTLVVRGLTHRYPGRSADAVSGVELTARRGEVIALVGVNGAGKTTTVHGILGLVAPTAGSVTVDGRTRDELGEDRWLGLFGLLTQEFGRYEFTVRETVTLGSPRDDITDGEVWAALDAAQAGDFVRAMVEGLDTQLGQQWGGVGVSGGQWQRLALARIYLRDAPIWILDEPTSAIDAEAEQEVFRGLQRTKADRITVVVSHRAWTLRGMDRIYVFEEGRIVEQGTFDDLTIPGGRFAEIFAEQF